MSKRAVGAYEDGEMPASKWTKARMLSAIDGYLDSSDLACDLDLEALRKDELFERFFYLSSWHHTSKFCNATDFYAIDEDALCDAARDMTPEELSERAERREDEASASAEMEAERVRRLMRQADLRASVMKRTGFAWGTLGAYASIFPERLFSSHTSRRNNLVLTLRAPDGSEMSGAVEMMDWRLFTSEAVDEAACVLELEPAAPTAEKDLPRPRAARARR